MSRRERQKIDITSGGDPNENVTDNQSRKAQKRRRIGNGGSIDSSGATVIVKQAGKVSIVAEDHAPVNDDVEIEVRPKSRKELRTEKKQAAKKANAASIAASAKPTVVATLSVEEQKIERLRLRKERRQETLKERKQQDRLKFKEQRQEKKFRKLKKRNREMNAPGGSGAKGKVEQQTKDKNQDTESDKKSPKPEAMDANVFNDLFNGTHDDTTGTTTLRLGVKYKDLVVGNGPVAQDRMLVSVKYKLTGGKFGVTIDSSKKFNFRLGKGEVIQGWDIGVVGMREGGRRQLIVPPKAGYGSQDIGAGSGATLFFDVTLLECRA